MEPTLEPTILPTTEPTTEPTMSPTNIPTYIPTIFPTHTPTILPSNNPTIYPTYTPTNIPSTIPTYIPTYLTDIPTILPTYNPTIIPTQLPSNIPTHTPTNIPTQIPTQLPSKVITMMHNNLSIINTIFITIIVILILLIIVCCGLFYYKIKTRMSILTSLNAIHKIHDKLNNIDNNINENEGVIIYDDDNSMTLEAEPGTYNNDRAPNFFSMNSILKFVKNRKTTEDLDMLVDDEITKQKKNIEDDILCTKKKSMDCVEKIECDGIEFVMQTMDGGVTPQSPNSKSSANFDVEVVLRDGNETRL